MRHHGAAGLGQEAVPVLAHRRQLGWQLPRQLAQQVEAALPLLLLLQRQRQQLQRVAGAVVLQAAGAVVLKC